MNRSRPHFIDQGKDSLLNLAGVVQWLFTMDAKTMAEMRRKKPDMAVAVLRFQERGRGALLAEMTKANPRDDATVFWEFYRCEPLELRLRSGLGGLKTMLEHLLNEPGAS